MRNRVGGNRLSDTLQADKAGGRVWEGVGGNRLSGCAYTRVCLSV